MKEQSSSNPQPDINRRIADRVSALRAERGLSLDALAKKCDVSRSMISLIERGESSPTAAVLDKLAFGLGVTLASLFEAPLPDASPWCGGLSNCSGPIRNRATSGAIFRRRTFARRFRWLKSNSRPVPR